jgi:hypothetical protein
MTKQKKMGLVVGAAKECLALIEPFEDKKILTREFDFDISEENIQAIKNKFVQRSVAAITAWQTIVDKIDVPEY